MDDAVVDASERVLDRLEANDDVAYAEVGGVDRRLADAVVTADGVRSANDHAETGVWWRVFVDGAADYRYATSFDDDHVDDLIERSTRAARLLDQSAPARYDWGTVHRAAHPGWAPEPDSLADVPAGTAAERVRTALADALEGVATDRTRSTYRGEHVECTVSTTTGTGITTALDRASTETVVVPAGGPKLRQHAGTTTGAAFLDSLPRRFEALADRACRTTAADRTAPDPGPAEVVLGPLAAGSLIHQVAHYLEIDAAYLESSPFDVGDRVGPDDLSIDDAVPPGSWAARAYDAEGRPAHSTSLVSGGEVTNRLYDVASAAEEGTHPAGNAVPSLGFDEPPRIHARHLDVAAGDATPPELRDGADLYVRRVGRPRLENEATRTKRTSVMPPSVPYARDVAAATPSDFDDEADDQEIRFPIAEAYVLDGGEPGSLVADGAIVVSPADLRNVTALGTDRRTLTGTCEKHRSVLPFAVTAPGMRLRTTVHGG